MKVKLSDAQNNPRKLQAVENFCLKNNKLLALRDNQNRLLAIGLSLRALQSSKSKDGFYHYQVTYKKIPLQVTKEEFMGDIRFISDEEWKIRDNEYAVLKNNNFLIEVIDYDCYICAYDGMISHRNEKSTKRELYWYNCYLYYLNESNTNKFIPTDLINTKVKDYNNQKLIDRDRSDRRRINKIHNYSKN